MIVRELVTRLSFAFNRNNLDRFEKAVTSFKGRVAVATGAITFAVSKILQAFNELATENLGFKNIANQAGFAADEFLALKGAAIDLGVSGENATRGFSKLGNAIQDAKRGLQGPFIEFFKKSGGKIRIPSQLLSDAQNFKNAFEDINNYLKEFPDQVSRLYVLKDIFDPQSALEWDQYFSHTLEEQEKALQKNKLSTKEIERQNELLREYQTVVNQISKESETLYRQFATTFLPAINYVLTQINNIINTTRQIANHETGVTGFLAESLNKPFPKKTFPLLEKLRGNSSNSQNTANTINNTIEINVPQGTTEVQSQYMADSLTQAMEEMFQYKAREIMNNNPQVE